MIHIREIDHLVLRVVDVDAMLHFYCDVLGCSLERRKDAIGLVPVDGPLGSAGGGEPKAGSHNLDHFCLRVEPFEEDAIRSHLATFGLNAGPLEIRYGAEGSGPSLYLEDPEGNVVELKGPPSR